MGIYSHKVECKAYGLFIYSFGKLLFLEISFIISNDHGSNGFKGQEPPIWQAKTNYVLMGILACSISKWRKICHLFYTKTKGNNYLKLSLILDHYMDIIM